MSKELEESRETVTCSVCVELFNDARILTCSHSFCMHCLIGCQAQGGEDGVTVLRASDEASNPQGASDGAENSDASELIVGSLIPENAVLANRPTLFTSNTIGSVAISVLLAASVATSFGFHYMSVMISLLIIMIGPYSALQVEKKNIKHHKEVFMCSGCNTRVISLLRYRCGMCNDFTLCPECFKMSDTLSQRQHVFLKLKYKQIRQLPLGPVLKPQAFSLAETFDFTATTHGRAYIHHPERLLRVPGIKCAFCGTMPIKGWRYKCGMCKNYDLCSQCENFAHKIHDKSHVFMVIKHKA